MLRFDPAALAGTAPGRIDPVDYVDGLPGLVIHPRPYTVPRGAPMLVSGWAMDPITNGTPRAICVLIDRTRSLITEADIARRDISGALRPSTNVLGYCAVVPTADLTASAHEARVFALAADDCWYETDVAGFTVYTYICPTTTQHGSTIRLHAETPVDAITGEKIAAGDPVPSNHFVLLHGWAMDAASLRGVAGIVATDALGRMWTGAANLPRPDVALMLEARDNRVGFEILLPAAALGRGKHRVEIAGLDQEGQRYANHAAVVLRVAGPAMDFPIAARVSQKRPIVHAEFRIALWSDDDDDDGIVDVLPWRTVTTAPLHLVRSEVLVIRGWALAEAGIAADDVYVEVAPAGAVVPPHRYLARAGRPAPKDAHGPPSGVDDAWFTCDIQGRDLSAGEYDVSLCIVDPGRRSLSRVTLTTLTVPRHQNPR